MKNDLYSKATLTVIAITLILNLLLNWKTSNLSFSYLKNEDIRKRFEVKNGGSHGKEADQQQPQAVVIVGVGGATPYGGISWRVPVSCDNCR